MDNTIQRVCELAKDFYSRRNISATQLAADSEVEPVISDLTVEKVESYLYDHPELIYFWLLRSDDKRVSSGWYFRKEAGRYVVAYFPQGERLEFDDEHSACAEFIVREMRELLPVTKPYPR